MRIKNLIEGLNAQQRSVPQLPAQARAKHISVLGAKTDPRHPFAGYAVGADESAEPGKKRIGPDPTDPYEKGWRAGFRHNESNPYPSASKEAQQWDDGYAEAEAQPDHYDESAESNMPDLEEVGEPVESIMDAERRMAAGDRIFVAHEMDEEPFEIHNVGDLKGYTYDQMLAVPQDVSEDLDEAVGGNYLYHATNSLKDILASGQINKSDFQKQQDATRAQTTLPTFSVTRDWNYAVGGKGTGQVTGTIGRSAIIVLDRNAVESNFRTLGTSQTSDKLDLRGTPHPGNTAFAYDVIKKQPDDAYGKKMIAGRKKMATPDNTIAPKNKIGQEFEEVVVVPKGSMPIKGTMVGFYIPPSSPLMKDPAVMNDPRRLDLEKGGTGRFVKAAQQPAQQAVAETTGDPKFDKMIKGITGKKAVAKQQKTDTKQQSRDAFGSMFGGTSADLTSKLKIREQGVAEACWKGYHKEGNKELFGKRVPNCVKNEGAERNELDTPAVQAALAKMAERHRGEKWSKEQLAALGKRIAARGQKPIKEDITKEDVISKLKAKLSDYLSDLSKEIKTDPDLKDKLAAKSPGDQMGPPVKTVTTDDGHEIQIHGNEDDGFRISIKNKPAASRFKNLDEAVMACEMYCARRRTQTESADYVEEAGKDACYNKVKSRYKIWPSAYASGALVRCRKVGAANWGNKSKK